MPIIGIDDTDSRTEMCTTFLTIEILKNSNLDLIGYPKLVRLNPNIPLKTRGNAAISLTLGRGEGERTKIGSIGSEEILSFKRYREERMDIDVFSIIEKFSPEDEDTNPALLVCEERNDENFYWDAVRDFVDYKKVRDKAGGDFTSANGDIGIVGANAAISWPEVNPTYELISYLEEKRWKGDHLVDDGSSMYIENNFKDTFDSFDFRNSYNAIRPTTKTPILFGVRGVDPKLLLDHIRFVKSEPYSSFIIYKTNQGTDDHLLERSFSNSGLYNSSIIRAFVDSTPAYSRGGVLSFRISSGRDTLTAVSMEPTKEFRFTMAKLRRGDELRVYGGITKPGFINLEKVEILSLSRVIEIRPPKCPKCKNRMESVGTNKGFRCRKCRTKSQKGEERVEEREVVPGYYEVPIIARRHLSRPLKLGIVK